MYFNDSDNLAELLHAVVDAESTYIHDHLRVLNLNPQQARLLKYVADHPGTLQKDLAAYLNRQSATVTNMLKTMVQRGYVEREIPQENERQKRIFLLPAGEKIVGTIGEIFAGMEQEIQSAVPVRQRALFTEQLKQIAAAIDHQSAEI